MESELSLAERPWSLDHAHFGWDVLSKTPKVKIISGSLNCKQFLAEH